MDKLKPTLLILKKHLFWVLLGLVMVVGPAIFAMTASGVWDQYLKRKDVVKGAFGKMDSLAALENHANEQRIENWKTLQKKQKLNVHDAWALLYNRQRDKNPWPKILPRDFLELVPNLPADKEIPHHLRQQYHVFISGHLHTLPKIVKCIESVPDPAAAGGTPAPAAPMAGMAGGLGGEAGGGQPGGKYVGVVNWNAVDFEELKKDFNFGGTPTSLQVRLAQEDLWVYEALLQIIAAANGPATDRSNATVKEIRSLEIGKRAAASIATSTVNLIRNAAPGAAPGGEGGLMSPGGEGGLMAPGGGLMMPGGDTGVGGMATVSDDVLLANRYSDEKMAPLAAGASVPYAEFKMMPFRMSLVVNSRKIPELLVECANSRMPAEVKRLRINGGSDTAGGGGGMPAGGGLLGGGMGGGGLLGGGMGGGGMAAPGTTPGADAASGDSDSAKQDVALEIQGIIYLYNPPDLSKVGTGTAAEASGEGVTGEQPATPAPATPAPATPAPATPAPAAPAPIAPAPATPAPAAPGP